MPLFNAQIPEQFLTEVTEATSVTTAGSSVFIDVKNNFGFTTGDFVIIREYGNEKAELATVTDLTGTNQIEVDTLERNVEIGDIITKVLYDQVGFYGATSATGTYTQIGSYEDLKVDSPEGNILEYTGTTYSWFKITYYNSSTTTETDIDDSEAIYGSTTDYISRLRDSLKDPKKEWFSDRELQDILEYARYTLSSLINYEQTDTSLSTDGSTYDFTLPFTCVLINDVGYYQNGDLTTLGYYNRDSYRIKNNTTLSFGVSASDSPTSGYTLYISYNGIIPEKDITALEREAYIMLAKAKAFEHLASSPDKLKRLNVDDVTWEYGMSQADYLKESSNLRALAVRSLTLSPMFRGEGTLNEVSIGN